MLRSLLNLKNAVKVYRITEASDGMGGLSASTVYTTLARANIWQPGSSDITISDKITKSSTHVLAIEYGAYTFTDDDREVVFGGQTYKLAGHADNVANRNELVVIGLELMT